MNRIHQYIRLDDGLVINEQLFADAVVRFLYSTVREDATWLFNALTGARISKWLGYMNFDLNLGSRLAGNKKFLENCGVNLKECIHPPEYFKTPRQIFERQIRYWETRPMSNDPTDVVSPADSRVVIGALQTDSLLFIKEKFFRPEELLGESKTVWVEKFQTGDFMICRLTPDKYHHNHTPTAGQVVDFYEIDGVYHSCNPEAVIRVVTPYSKNKRVVTIIDTDVPRGTGIGLVAMIEVVALMIGDIVQCYSAEKYNDPQPIVPGMFLEKGVPKSLYRPGSSTTIVLFEPHRIDFIEAMQNNCRRADINSRFSHGFNQNLVETEITVRTTIAQKRKG